MLSIIRDTHSLTAAFDQRKVVAISTTCNLGRDQQISHRPLRLVAATFSLDDPLVVSSLHQEECHCEHFDSCNACEAGVFLGLDDNRDQLSAMRDS